LQDIQKIGCAGAFIDKIKDLWDSVRSDQKRRLYPFVYHYMREYRYDFGIPEVEVNGLEHMYYRTVASNLSKIESAIRMLQIFQREGISAIPLKGLALIETVYRDPGIRPMADIDLMVDRNDFQSVKDILTDMGYAFVDSFRGSIDFTDMQNELFDIHAQFTKFDALFHIDYAEIRSRLRSVSIGGQIQTGILCPEHQVIHIALHLAPGLYTGLNFLNLIDLYYVIADPGRPLDWDYFAAFSTRARMNSYLYAPLFLCRQLFNAEIPESILGILCRGLSKKKIAHVRNDCLESILNGGGAAQGLFLERLWWAEKFPNKMRLVRSALFPDRAEMAQRFSVPDTSVRIYWYYLVRLRKLIDSLC